MKQTTVKLFKVFGVFLLIVLASIGVLAILVFVVSGRSSRWNEGVAIHKDTSATQNRVLSVRFSLPDRIYGTPYSLSHIMLVDPDARSRFEVIGSYGSKSGDEYGTAINIAILDVKRNDFRLIFSRPALIRDINRPEKESDSLQPVLLYEAYVNDTNGDGIVGSKDNLTLFSSELDGRGLTQVTPDSLSVTEWKFTEGLQKLIISAKVRPAHISDEDRPLPRRLFWYDLKSKVLYSQPSMDRLLETTKQILVK
jgi:hypothetical protein